MDKKELRKYMKDLRGSIPEHIKSQYDEAIYNKVVNSTYYNCANVIFVYVSFGTEVDTHKIIKHALSYGKRVCVPKVLNRAEGMKAVEIRSLEDLKESSFGVLEPENSFNAINPEDIDLILIPGLAFDKSGGRLGYGAGYYDGFLKKVKAEASKVALAYSSQVIDKVPLEEHDVLIENIITN